MKIHQKNRTCRPVKAALTARIYVIIDIIQYVMAHNIYHIYITNIKDNGVIEHVHIRLKNLYPSQIGANT